MTRDGEWEIVHKDQPRKFFCVEKEPECENFFSEDLVISGRWYRESSSKGHRGDLKRISPEFAAGQGDFPLKTVLHFKCEDLSKFSIRKSVKCVRTEEGQAHFVLCDRPNCNRFTRTRKVDPADYTC